MGQSYAGPNPFQYEYSTCVYSLQYSLEESPIIYGATVGSTRKGSARKGSARTHHFVDL